MVLDRSTRLRIRRIFRRRQRQVKAAEEQFDKVFFNRLERLIDVKRFVAGWLFLVVAIITLTILQTIGLAHYYTTLGPVPGGIYNEGMVGVFSNANPIYATGPVDTSIVRLIFAGLFKYDNHNKLIGDLASSYDIDSTGRIYTVHLKPNLTWQDGAKLTSQDILFTYRVIQNPDVGSPLFTSWQGITLAAPNDTTVIFHLPNAFTAFPYSLTNGIVPEHILKNVAATQLRTSNFNNVDPIGAGPFAWDTLQASNDTSSSNTTTLISLKAFDHYNGGKPLLNGFVLHVFTNINELVDAYKSHAVQAMAGLQNVPGDIALDASSHVYNFSTTAATMVFFKNSQAPFDDTTIRHALVLSTDRQSIIEKVGDNVKAVDGPLLHSQLPYYDKAFSQTTYDPAAAAVLLDQDGWRIGKDGIRMKNNQPLTFQVTAEDTPDDRATLGVLQKDWAAIGVNMKPLFSSTTDFQSAVETHSYSALLYGIAIGIDPDVFVYWDSSQSDPSTPNRLNFSEYKSTAADEALEAGRTRQDPLVRVVKYDTFQKAWSSDNPALGLYQPSSIYITRGPVTGLVEHALNTDADRYYSVNSWSIKTGNIPKT